MSINDFRDRKKNIICSLDNTLSGLDSGYKEAVRVNNIVKNTRQILDDLDEQFCKKTMLTKTDVTFLFLALGLQLARQYLLTNDKFRFAEAKDGDKLMANGLSILPPDWKDVLIQSVPYDAIRTSKGVEKIGLSGTTHRYRTLGHDPVLGWVFGTANIMTNSLTKTNFETYQVNDMVIAGNYPAGVVGMLGHSMAYARDNPKLLAASITRQAVHFGSDYFTKQGLPVPGLALVNDDLVGKMIVHGNIDMWSITRQASLAAFINYLIAIMHSIFFDGTSEMDRKLYEVRTRKILKYSNVIAASSNIALVAVTRDFKKLDIGGIAVAIYRLITDVKFIKEIEEEFIFGSYKNMIMGDC